MQIVKSLQETPEPVVFVKCINVMWAIWKTRNKLVYSGKPATLQSFSRYLDEVSDTSAAFKFAKLAGKPFDTEAQVTIQHTTNSFDSYMSKG